MTKVTKTKKLLAAVLCLALLFSLAMCSRSCVSSKTSHSKEQEKELISQAVRASMDPMVGNSGEGIISYEITDVQISDERASVTVKITYLDESEAVNKGTDEYIAKVLGGEAESDELHKECIEEARKTTDPKEAQKESKINAGKKDDSWKVEVLPEDITNAADGDIEITKRVLSKKVETVIGTTNDQSPSTQQTPADQTQQPASDPQPQTQVDPKPQEQQPADPPKEEPKQDDEAAKRAEEEAARKAAEEEAARKAAEEEAARKAAEEEAKKKKEEEEALHVHTHQWEDIVEIRHHEAKKELQPVEIEPAWDEEIWEEAVCCQQCDQYFIDKDNPNAAVEAWDIHSWEVHDGGSYRVDNVCTGTIHHEAVVEQQWVVTAEEYDEEVVVGQKCSICGETK